MTESWSTTRWSTFSAASFIATVINIYLLKQEHTKQRNEQNNGISRRLHIWCMLCMTFGFISLLGSIFSFFDYVCNICTALKMGLNVGQYVFMGFFQLSRLHYCYRQETEMSKVRHMCTKFSFRFLYCIGCIIFLWFSILPSIYGAWTIECGMNLKHWTYYEECLRCNPQYARARNAGGMVLYTWDFLVLFLYIHKLCSFKQSNIKHSEDNTYLRTTRILVRILILTLLYEMTFVFAIVTAIISQVTGYDWIGDLISFILLFQPLIMNCSIYLMQAHNSKQYRTFLKWLHILKLDCLCCCCKYTILYELDQIEINNKMANANHNSNSDSKEKQTNLNSGSNIAMTATSRNKNGHMASVDSEFEIDSILMKPMQYELFKIYNRSQEQFVTQCEQIGLCGENLNIVMNHFKGVSEIKV